MGQERRLYACGFNRFGQLPLQEQKICQSRQITFPKRCIYCPPASTGLALFVAVSWSRCLFKNGGQEIVSHGFSSSSSDDQETLQAGSDVGAVHCFHGTCVALPSSSSGLLIEKSSIGLKHVQINMAEGQRGVKVNQLDSDEKNMFAITDQGQVGRIEETEQGGDYLYRPLFSKQRVKALSCGKEHTLILTDAGEVYSMGSGSRGQLGHGTVEERLETPALIEAIAAVPVVNISAGGWHSAAVSECGDLYIWGWNESGQLGYPMTEKPIRKRKIARDDVGPSLEDDQSSRNGRELEDPYGSCSSPHSSADAPTEAVTFLMSPQLLDMAPPTEVLIQSVSCGSRHTAALTREGGLYTWGYGRWGQLGHGNEWTLDKPTEVIGLGGCVVEVYCREWNTFILTREGVT